MIDKRSINIGIKKIKKMDHALILKIFLIIGLSLTAVYTATSYRTMSYFKKEIIWTCLGVFVYYVVSFIDYRKYGKYYRLIYVANILMLAAVYVFGDEAKGAKRWIDLGVISVQPSEFAKLFLVLTFAEVLIIDYGKNFRGLKDMFLSSLHILPIFLMVLHQPDLGTSLVLIFIYFVMIFVHGIDWKTIWQVIILGAASIPVAYFFVLKDYQRTRIQTFLNPEADLMNSGWNVVQSKIAIGSGGLFGKGFMQSTQSKLRFLPESHTDFIGSVFLEERGFAGGVLLIVLYLALIMNIIKIGDSAEDKYGKLIC